MCNQGGIKKVGKCQITKRQTVAIGGANADNDDDGHQWYFCDTLDKHWQRHNGPRVLTPYLE